MAAAALRPGSTRLETCSSVQVLKLLGRRERWLAVAAIRFLRTCLAMKDEFYNRYVVSMPAAGPPVLQPASGAKVRRSHQARAGSRPCAVPGNSCPCPTMVQLCVKPSGAAQLPGQLPVRALNTSALTASDHRCEKG